MLRNKKNIITIYKTDESLNEAAAQLIADLAEKAVKERGRFVLSLSGGNTPKKLYALLAEKPFSKLPSWKNTFVFWGDERCVPMDDERNNAHMASDTLLKKIPIPSSNISPMPVELPPAEAAEKYEQTLRDFFGKDEPCFDLILLGLGDNGHTASLFPKTPVLHEQVRWVKDVVVKDHAADVKHRITFTAPLINKARQILFLVTGIEKSEVLEKVLTGAYQPDTYPAQLIKPEQGEIHWFIDDKAASNVVLSVSVSDSVLNKQQNKP